ncbi:uncharacterized protein BDV14DRAFT_49046 [Aspergillus stella-maris]|uniref:uncharacterized protein n=1 Tax=Aspergillus stella-maris TaxID=1810926 RepID=UPI003CCDE63C
MTTSSGNQPWNLKKVLVHAPNCNVSCVTRLHIIHGQTANQASISLSITTTLANSSRPQVLSLNIPPERVEQCGLALRSNDSLCPSHLLSLHPAPVENVSAISTLSLRLNMVGIVRCPSGLDSLTPAIPEDLKFYSFAQICQSKFLRLYFSGRQFLGNNYLDKLHQLSNALQQRSLQAVPFDTARHGVLERDWRVFALSPDPPPYCQDSEQVDPYPYLQYGGKRRRDRSMSPNDKERKTQRLPPPQLIGSPTEVNTPSTRAPSRSPSSIRPTDFRRASSPSQTEHQTHTYLVRKLRGVSDDRIRKLLIESGHEHLLATPQEVDSSPEADMVIDRRLEQYVDKRIECQLDRYVKKIERRFEQHVDLAVTECRDQASEFQEQIDDGNLEVQNTAKECVEEIEDQVQSYLDDLKEQAQQCMKDVKDQVTNIQSTISTKEKFQPWSKASAQPLLDGKSSTCRELGVRTRRSSI